MEFNKQETVWLAAVDAWGKSFSILDFNDWLEKQKLAGKFWGA